MFALLRRTAEELLPYENVDLQCFLTDTDVITDLDNYADHIHMIPVTARLVRSSKPRTREI